MKRNGCVAIFLVLGVLAACGSEAGTSSAPAPPITDYDQTCGAADDCVAVFTGDPCGCSCDAGAINRSERLRYLDDRKKACADPPDCGACSPSRALCTAGRCTVEVCPTGGCVDDAG